MSSNTEDGNQLKPVIPPGRNWSQRIFPILLFMFAFFCEHVIQAQTNTNSFQVIAGIAYKEARSRYEAQPSKDELCWQFARSAFDWAEFATNDTQRATIAIEAIAICRQLLERSPKLAAAHYYLAMNLGQLARTKTLGALKIVNEMEKEFKLALSIDPTFDYHGPERNLGLLYLDAPGWPASIGSNSKARTFLGKAAEHSPDYPENLLNIAEAHLRWGEKAAAQKILKSLETLWAKAKSALTGPQWGASWVDWTKRREKAELSFK